MLKSSSKGEVLIREPTCHRKTDIKMLCSVARLTTFEKTRYTSFTGTKAEGEFIQVKSTNALVHYTLEFDLQNSLHETEKAA